MFLSSVTEPLLFKGRFPIRVTSHERYGLSTLCKGIPRSPVLSPHKGPASDARLTCYICHQPKNTCWNKQSSLWLFQTPWRVIVINLLHKSHNVPVPYLTMLHLVTVMCTYVRISFTKWYIVGYISDALSDLWVGSIVWNCFLLFYRMTPNAPFQLGLYTVLCNAR